MLNLLLGLKEIATREALILNEKELASVTGGHNGNSTDTTCNCNTNDVENVTINNFPNNVFLSDREFRDDGFLFGLL